MLIISWVYQCNCTVTEASQRRTILRIGVVSHITFRRGGACPSPTKNRKWWQIYHIVRVTQTMWLYKNYIAQITYRQRYLSNSTIRSKNNLPTFYANLIDGISPPIFCNLYHRISAFLQNIVFSYAHNNNAQHIDYKYAEQQNGY